MKVGEFLMKMIFFSGMSQKEFAEKIHTSAPVLNDMIKRMGGERYGRRNIPLRE